VAIPWFNCAFDVFLAEWWKFHDRPERYLPSGEAPMTRTTTFKKDIRPLFTEQDIEGMSKAFDLGSYDDVKKHASAIYDRIRGIGGAVMPPPPPKGGGPWDQSRIELFAKWMEDGFLP
jgi:hypothetical protein